MKILLADDHQVLRKGLVQILAEAFPEARFGEASSARETLDALSFKPWDVLILDIFMPDRGGLDVLRDIRREHPDLPVLVLSSAPEDQLAVRVLKSGARGYMNKQAAAEELVRAVKKVARGGRYVSETLAERMAAQVGQDEGSLEERLSDREFDVLKRIVAGESVQGIARALSLSPKTISTYHTRIWEKLGVANDAELIRYALAHGLT